ncbi:MAG TPA: nucleotidyltransferase domain-containing protein, partial [bacterium]|nr:nucleotidyltransferase domain-containing protein [bacterium]
MSLRATYPTPAHERAAHAVVAVFSELTGSEAVILTGSCARGRATSDSCLDIVVLASHDTDREGRRALEARWERAYQTDVAFRELRSVGR